MGLAAATLILLGAFVVALGAGWKPARAFLLGRLPQGGIARLMRTHNDHLIDSAGLAVQRATCGLQASDPPLVVSVSCVGRRLVLGERTDEEVETVVEGAPRDAGHVGFYSYGEIAPALAGGGCDLHNQTMTVTVFSESTTAGADA